MYFRVQLLVEEELISKLCWSKITRVYPKLAGLSYFPSELIFSFFCLTLALPISFPYSSPQQVGLLAGILSEDRASPSPNTFPAIYLHSYRKCHQIVWRTTRHFQCPTVSFLENCMACVGVWGECWVCRGHSEYLVRGGITPHPPTHPACLLAIHRQICYWEGQFSCIWLARSVKLWRVTEGVQFQFLKHDDNDSKVRSVRLVRWSGHQHPDSGACSFPGPDTGGTF